MGTPHGAAEREALRRRRVGILVITLSQGASEMRNTTLVEQAEVVGAEVWRERSAAYLRCAT